MMRLVRCLLAALTIAVLSGCFASDGGDCLRPIDEFIPPTTPTADRTAEDGEYFFLVADGAQFRVDVDSVLCSYATGLEHTVPEPCFARAAPASGDAP